MGNNLFGADIAGKLAAALGDKIAPIVLTRRTPGALDPLDPAAGTQLVPVEHKGRGFIDTKGKNLLDSAIGFGGGRRIAQGTAKISILGNTIAVVPVPNDVIEIYGQKYSVVAVDSDPDAALYECTCRGGA